MTRREEMKKWNWMVDWCKENNLSYSNSEAWEKAEKAWKSYHPVRNRTVRKRGSSIAVLGMAGLALAEVSSK